MFGKSKFAVLSLGLLVVIAAQKPAYTADPIDQVKSAAKAMHDWVGSGSNGQAWRRYLKSDDLEAQLTLGSDADVATLTTIAQRYGSGTAGLDKPQFAAVEKALGSWLAELQMPTTAELPALARDSKESFSEITPAKVAAAKKLLAARVAKLDTYLSPGSNSAAWRKYLQLEDLKAQLADKAEPDLKVLAKAYRTFTADHVGLEMPVFTGVTDAIQHYVDLVATSSRPDPEALYQKQVDALATSLESYATDANESESYNIGQRLGWLDGIGQAPLLLRAARRNYSKPNMFGEVSASLVTEAMAQTIEKDHGVRDNILGTSITGTGHTTGTITARLIPSSTRAIIETVFKGAAKTRTTGYNGPATIYARATTSFIVLKRLVLDRQGLHGQASRAAANTASRVTGIGGSQMVQNIAWRRVGEAQGQANRIASRNASRRLEREVDSAAAGQLKETNRAWNDKFMHPLERKRQTPQLMQFSTTEESLLLTMMQADRSQLGSPTAPPSFDQPRDLGVRIHTSMFNNFATAIFSGRKMTDEDMREEVVKMRGELPEEMKPDPNEDPWSITFTRRLPISVLMDDDHFTVTIRGRKFTSGDNDFGAMNISATYKIEQQARGSVLTRQGEISILPPRFVEGEGRLSAGEITLQTILRRKFAKMFKDKFESQGIELPIKQRDGKPDRIIKLLPVEMATADSWLKIGWRLASKDKVAETDTGDTATK